MVPRNTNTQSLCGVGLFCRSETYRFFLCVFLGADTAAGVVATLLEAGADVNKDDGDPEVRYTPLHSAVAREVRDTQKGRSMIHLFMSILLPGMIHFWTTSRGIYNTF